MPKTVQNHFPESLVKIYFLIVFQKKLFFENDHYAERILWQIYIKLAEENIFNMRLCSIVQLVDFM